MHEVTVNRDDLLEVLQTNRDAHRSIFDKALVGYEARLEEELQRRLDDLRKGRKVNQFIGLPEPEDHTKDYDRVLTMVKMSVSNQITLTAQEFAQFVMDDWAWKQGFTTTASNYTAV